MIFKAFSAVRIRLCMLGALLLLNSAAALASVEISFYSKEFGSSFPHAFVALKGTIDATGEKIDSNYGFTATRITPAVLVGAVKGEVMAVDDAYLRKSDRHFSIMLSDEEYRRVIETVERWRTLKQPSYHLNRQNCVYFVADVAAALGMVSDTPASLMKKPRSYLQRLMKVNQSWFSTRPIVASRAAASGAPGIK